jgi:hypothetical protein
MWILRGPAMDRGKIWDELWVACFTEREIGTSERKLVDSWRIGDAEDVIEAVA